jgi:hypothetical protein
MSQAATGTTFSDLLLRASQALVEWAESVTRIEGVLDVAGPTTLDAEHRVALQDIDLLRQRLENLAVFLAHLAKVEGPQGAIRLDVDRALDPLHLHDLRLHLSGSRIEARAEVDRFSLF